MKLKKKVITHKNDDVRQRKERSIRIQEKSEKKLREGEKRVRGEINESLSTGGRLAMEKEISSGDTNEPEEEGGRKEGRKEGEQEGRRRGRRETRGRCEKRV